MLFLTSEDLIGLAEPADYVDAVREAYRQRGEGAPAEPRQTFVNQNPPGMLTSYGAILPESGVMGGYMYSAGFESNDAWFMTPLFDAQTGEPLALLDGASMNPLKTGAAGAVGLDVLSREDASTLSIIGSGTQAAGQLRGATTVRNFSEVRVFSPTRNHRESFAKKFNRELKPMVRSVDSCRDAVSGADVIVTATKATEPVLEGDWLDDGAHVTAMGQYHPRKRELDVRTIQMSTYVPDLRKRATQDAGSFLAALEKNAVTEEHIHAELGEVVAGTAPGRSSLEEITVFDSGGTAIETVAAAQLLYSRAIEEGLGTEVSIQAASEVLNGPQSNT